MPEGSGIVRAAIVAALLVGAPFGGARAWFERASLPPRAVAAGGACSSATDDLSSIFFNPAGLASIAGSALYADYGEPRSPRSGRETRSAAGFEAGFGRCALAWYRLDGGGGVEDLLVAGCARTLVSGSQGSYVAIGADVAVGRVASASDGSGEASWTKGTVDAGIVARPLPVISLAWAGGNLLEAAADGGEGAWERSSRFGMSYYWEDAFVFSFESRSAGGASTRHYGVLARTSTSLEIMFGLSAGGMTGGARWNGGRVRCTVAFDGGDAGGATWSVGLEVSPGPAGEGER